MSWKEFSDMVDAVLECRADAEVVRAMYVVQDVRCYKVNSRRCVWLYMVVDAVGELCDGCHNPACTPIHVPEAPVDRTRYVHALPTDKRQMLHGWLEWSKAMHFSAVREIVERRGCGDLQTAVHKLVPPPLPEGGACVVRPLIPLKM